MTVKKYRLVEYEADTEEILSEEISHSIHPDSPIHFKPGMKITVFDVDPTFEVHEIGGDGVQGTISPIDVLRMAMENHVEMDPADVLNLQRYNKMETALKLLLDQVDYVAGNCRANEAVGAVLPASLLAKVKMELLGIGPEDMKSDITYPPGG